MTTTRFVYTLNIADIDWAGYWEDGEPSALQPYQIEIDNEIYFATNAVLLKNPEGERFYKIECRDHDRQVQHKIVSLDHPLFFVEDSAVTSINNIDIIEARAQHLSAPELVQLSIRLLVMAQKDLIS